MVGDCAADGIATKEENRYPQSPMRKIEKT